MTDLLEWTEELLDRELELRRAWAGRDPEYRTAVRDSRRCSFLSHKEAPTGRGWTEMRRPGPFTARARRSKEPSAIALKADRILTEARRRSLAKLEWFDDAELGPVLAATVTSEHLNLQGTPTARWWVAELGDGPRVVRIDRICPS